MGSVDLDYLKQGFASLVQQAKHTTLPTFILWLDLKVAEYKVNGYMMLGMYKSCVIIIIIFSECFINKKADLSHFCNMRLN